MTPNWYLDKYIVLKNADIDKYLNEKEKYYLDLALSSIAIGRLNDGLTAEDQYIVVNKKKPYIKRIEEIVDREEFYASY